MLWTCVTYAQMTPPPKKKKHILIVLSLDMTGTSWDRAGGGTDVGGRMILKVIFKEM